MTSVYHNDIFVENSSNTFTLDVNIEAFVESFSRTRICKRGSTGFHNLPTNILLNIFKYLSEKELRHNIIPVCHKWRQVAHEPELWKNIRFEGYHIPSSFICRQLRSLPNLQAIYLIKIDDVTTVIRQICRCNTQLKIFVMHSSRNDKVEERISENVLRNLIATCRRLHKIDLNGIQFTGNMFFIEVALLPFLRSINLSNNEFLTTKNIIQLVLNCPQLEEFKLSYRSKNQYMSDNDAVFLFTNLKLSLKSISFDMMELTDISFKTLLECPKLEKIYLHNALNISSEVITSIQSKLYNLSCLRLHHSQISTSDLVELFPKDSPNFITIQIIDLTGSLKLQSEGLQLLAKSCPNLKQAFFRSCKNLESIDCLVKNCVDLEVLDTAFCSKLSNIALLDASLTLPLLDIIYTDISRCDLSEEIKKNKPNLIIHICLSEFNKNMERIC